MAQNIMRLDSMNNRYVTETMIGLNLNLNEEIDFDFFDNIHKPGGEIQIKKVVPTNNPVLTTDSPNDVEDEHVEDDDTEDDDDDDVQVSPQLLYQDNINSKPEIYQTAENSLPAETLLSNETENVENFSNNFEDLKPLSNVEVIDSSEGSDDRIVNHVIYSWLSDVGGSSSLYLRTSGEVTLVNKVNDDVKSLDDSTMPTSSSMSSKEHNVSFSESEKAQHKTASASKTIKSCEDADHSASCGAILPGLSHSSNECSKTEFMDSQDSESNLSLKNSESPKYELLGNSSDSDEGCQFEGSDNDELLLAVHSLTIIPRERDERSHMEEVSELLEEERNMQCITPHDETNVTARLSSGYSSASCKASGCTASKRVTISKANLGQEASTSKTHNPDIDEIIRSFTSLHTSSPAVSFSSGPKLTPGHSRRRPRKNMSFSNQEMQRIERENAILLNKIVLQQRARPPVIHNYERRVTSNAINRARQLKKIDYDNEILLKKIQDAKRRSTSLTSSRCTSQASSSQV